ncbi:unnamed protein product [Arabis nemorensis]|uniref:Pentacotripeptide-repeat region of PRORP domain-containing protein n=1 Tax=Arabis nemorensis TaxID=586526 RepID=A0A565APJ3_9BRAS|nr:unnamed protein product [Arabis nemorensis]
MFDDGNPEQAIEFWKDQLRNGCPPYRITYTVLVELVCRYCGSTQAMEVLEDMAVEGCHPDIVTYNSLVNYNCRRGNLEEVALVIPLQHSSTFPLFPRPLIYGFCRANLVEEASQVLKETSNRGNGIRASTYRLVIQGLCKNKEMEMAIQVVEIVLTSGRKPDETILTAIIKGVEEM